MQRAGPVEVRLCGAHLHGDTNHLDHFSGIIANNMNTQDFLLLHSQGKEEPFKILDEIIARMKENAEEVGEALEKLVEMVKETSDSNIALKLLEKTLEGMDQSTGKE